jgi:ketosteroid isomerase-like protein
VGLDEVTAATSGWLEQWEHPFVIEAQEFVEGEGGVAVVVRWRGRSRLGGSVIEDENTHLWQLRAGKAVRFDVYRDRERALAALRDLRLGDDR